MKYLTVLVLVFVMGCATGYRKAQSSGYLGCDEEEIQISKEKSGMTLGGASASWIAECNNKKVFCSETNNGMIGGRNLACSKVE